MKKLWLAVVIIPALLPIVLPMLEHPSSASDMIFHGDIGVVAVGVTILLTALLWLGRRARAVSDPNERLAMAGRFFKQGLPLLVLLGFGIFSLHEIQTGHALRALQRHGQRVTADVVEIFTGPCGRSGCSIMVKYRFTPVTGATSASSVTGYGYLANSQDRDDPRLQKAEADHKLPVAYEVGNPENSALNFDDRVFARDQMSVSYSMIKGMGFVVGLIIISLVFVGWTLGRRRVPA